MHLIRIRSIWDFIDKKLTVLKIFYLFSKFEVYRQQLLFVDKSIIENITVKKFNNFMRVTKWFDEYWMDQREFIIELL